MGKRGSDRWRKLAPLRFEETFSPVLDEIDDRPIKRIVRRAKKRSTSVVYRAREKRLWDGVSGAGVGRIKAETTTFETIVRNDVCL